jgi:hypothetical protein
VKRPTKRRKVKVEDDGHGLASEDEEDDIGEADTEIKFKVEELEEIVYTPRGTKSRPRNGG